MIFESSNFELFGLLFGSFGFGFVGSGLFFTQICLPLNEPLVYPVGQPVGGLSQYASPLLQPSAGGVTLSGYGVSGRSEVAGQDESLTGLAKLILN